ncbi:MAG TPA: hypothetical protein VH040_04235 [Usitatibacter sp.]|jgi:hypothetical protein|nr:hypothetical protein [Usitatibacter sp.]
MKLSHLLAALGFAAASACAQWIDPATSKPLPDQDWRKTVEGLGGMLVLTKDYDAFMKQWTQTGESQVPEFHPAAGAKAGESVTAMVFFSGCADTGNPCKLVVDFKVLKPDGSTYGDVPNVAAFDGKIAKRNVVMLTRATVRLKIEPADPVGAYTIIAKLRDAKGGHAMELRQILWVE